MATTKSIAPIAGEKWAVITGQKSAYGDKYAISNHGRLVKFSKDVHDGKLLKGSLQEGYPIWRYRQNGEHRHILIHRLVAKYFLAKPKKAQTVLIHLNFKKKDNHYKNLKWTTMAEAIAHQQSSPAVIKAKKFRRDNPQLAHNTKLKESEVRMIKKMLAKGKTLKEIATKYDVSDMQIYRIKIGENWKTVK